MLIVVYVCLVVFFWGRRRGREMGRGDGVREGGSPAMDLTPLPFFVEYYGIMFDCGFPLLLTENNSPTLLTH